MRLWRATVDEYAAERRRISAIASRLRGVAIDVERRWENESWDALSELADTLDRCSLDLRQLLADERARTVAE